MDLEIIANKSGATLWDDHNILELDCGNGCTTL